MLSIFFHEYESDWHVRPFQTQLSVQHHLRYSNQTYFEWQQIVNHSKNWKPLSYLELCEYVFVGKGSGTKFRF